MNRTALEALIWAGALDDLGDRACLLAAVDSALKAGKQEAKNAGQASLFGAVEIAVSERPLPQAAAMDDKTKADGEREVLGFPLVLPPPPPSSPYATPGWRSMLGQEVVVIGRITAVREITDRKGNAMAFISLEDGEGSFEATAFSRVWEKIDETMSAEGAVLLLRGRVEAGKHGPSLVVAQALASADAGRLPVDEVRIAILPQHIADGPLSALGALLSRFRGSVPVSYDVTTSSALRASVRVGEQLYVGPSPTLARQVDALLGPGSCRFVRSAPERATLGKS